VASAALALPQLSLAQKTQAPYDTAATWLRTPSNAEVESVKPAAAIKEGLDGRVTLQCLVTVLGALTNCTVASEKPAGKGFGEAALVLTPRFQMRPAMKAGKPVESWVAVPINMSGSGARPTDSFIRGSTTAGMHRVISNAAWIKLPTFEEVAAAYPAKAKAAGKTGRASLHCRFGKEGELRGCTTSQEEPAGYGFGAAARQLSTSFQAPSTMQGLGAIADVEIELPVAFTQDMITGKRAAMTHPVWVQQPSEAVMKSVFPARAMAAGVGRGVVVLGCQIGPQGGLAGCVVEKEDPKDLGFAQAALSASASYQVRRWTDEGLPSVGQPIHIAVGYDLAPPELAALKAGRGGN
jgi:TonB family protein